MLVPHVGHCAIAAKWRGRKSVAACRRIFDLLGPHDALVEPFGGAGRVTLYSMARRRWWNDLDPRLHRLAVALRDRPGALAADCAGVDLGAWKAVSRRDPKDWPTPLFAAACALTFGGRLEGRLHDHVKVRQAWDAWIQRIPETSQLLQNVRLTCMDWRDVVASCDSRWAVYADPPYAESMGYQCGEGMSYPVLFDALKDRHAVVSGWHEGASAPDRWQCVESPTKLRRRVRQRHFGETFRTECEWINPPVGAPS